MKAVPGTQKNSTGILVPGQEAAAQPMTAEQLREQLFAEEAAQQALQGAQTQVQEQPQAEEPVVDEDAYVPHPEEPEWFKTRMSKIAQQRSEARKELEATRAANQQMQVELARLQGLVSGRTPAEKPEEPEALPAGYMLSEPDKVPDAWQGREQEWHALNEASAAQNRNTVALVNEMLKRALQTELTPLKEALQGVSGHVGNVQAREARRELDAIIAQHPSLNDPARKEAMMDMLTAKFSPRDGEEPKPLDMKAISQFVASRASLFGGQAPKPQPSTRPIPGARATSTALPPLPWTGYGGAPKNADEVRARVGVLTFRDLVADND